MYSKPVIESIVSEYIGIFEMTFLLVSFRALGFLESPSKIKPVCLITCANRIYFLCFYILLYLLSRPVFNASSRNSWYSLWYSFYHFHYFSKHFSSVLLKNEKSSLYFWHREILFQKRVLPGIHNHYCIVFLEISASVSRYFAAN